MDWWHMEANLSKSRWDLYDGIGTHKCSLEPFFMATIVLARCTVCNYECMSFSHIGKLIQNCQGYRPCVKTLFTIPWGLHMYKFLQTVSWTSMPLLSDTFCQQRCSFFPRVIRVFDNFRPILMRFKNQKCYKDVLYWTKIKMNPKLNSKMTHICVVWQRIKK